ncbi:SPOSA6832_00184 [Sporobolomyces salmonicolor]|uniref:UDP-N-acetylglucosamine transferase subunit ALG14 n=1 Tax=Sporidiobolus salmonicolor TaxID=5005 RepID=A0A0D6EFE8_SPOSA|nr:SPOSA6832_00184 [Sporobolomyces salmonicolor]
MRERTYLRLLIYSITAFVSLIAAFAVRLALVLHQQHSGRRTPPRRSKDEQVTLAVFLGSAERQANTLIGRASSAGGHTAEMMRVVGHLEWKRFSSRIWIISSGDELSGAKALALEKQIGSGSFRILRIPRARRVHQSYMTSPFTTLYSLAYCLWHISLAPLLAGGRARRIFADLVLLNGPGSCVPIAASAFLPRLVYLPSPALIYVESLARTRRLSLSAKLVRSLVDRFFVQWESLRDELVAKDGAWKGRWRLHAKVECQGWLV